MDEFRETVKERKDLARNNRYRNHTTPGCKLPFEYLPKKEQKNLNGECVTVKLDEPMTWEAFKALPDHLQTEYLQHVVDRFDVGLNSISIDMFGLRGNGVARHLKRHNLETIRTRKGQRPSDTVSKWREWVSKSKPTIAPKSEEPAPEAIAELAAEIAKHPRANTDPDAIKPLRAHDPIIPLRAHDYKDRFVGDIGSKIEEGKPNCYPTTGAELTLKGTPTEIMAALVGAFPALLDPDKAYRCTIHIDDFVL